ncbi:tetratricopeptide repeat protein [Guptibacillus algicola]|uniref:tetratricopeptide repeat protein n=1 Tax=Guptibacillus algicola TaxID=225844 RepID=UPI001CD46B77|nr:tetratricopeptide repeat protein [Alkalihalobacillus algicola]MCA0986255.1 tetratricopeptide repeat protein [Alkalihalobacillus algicola]
MDKEKDERKIVYFPNVASKLAEKGMAALKEKKIQQAHEHFSQLLEIDPDHPQGHFGLVLSLVELGELTEASDRCEKMMQQGIGDYYDIFQVYISILVQLGKYQKVVTMIEAVLEEHQLPSNIAESLYQLLHFSRKMTGYDVASDDKHNDVQDEDPDMLIDYLESEQTEKQWLAIQKLSNVSEEIAIPAYLAYINATGKDPLLKSLVLQVLREKKLDQEVTIHKFGREISVNPSELTDIFIQEFSLSVKKKLSDHVEQENPVLFEMCMQIWWHYLFAISPFEAEPKNSSVWAAAVHIVASDINGESYTSQQIGSIYGVKPSEFEVPADRIKRIENQPFYRPFE